MRKLKGLSKVEEGQSGMPKVKHIRAVDFLFNILFGYTYDFQIKSKNHLRKLHFFTYD